MLIPKSAARTTSKIDCFYLQGLQVQTHPKQYLRGTLISQLFLRLEFSKPQQEFAGGISRALPSSWLESRTK